MHDITSTIKISDEKPYDLSIVFGRFQPFHNQHAELLKEAWTISDYTIVVLGSSNRPKTPKNPFSSTDRKFMIEEYVDKSKNKNKKTIVVESVDFLYSDSTWVQQIQNLIGTELMYLPVKNPKITIVGCKKDESSNYLDMFPSWSLHEIPYSKKVSATDIRRILFEDELSLDYISGVVPECSMCFLERYKKTQEYKEIKEEYNIIKDYKKSWEAAPYAPTFVTTDAVVIQSGHILLIERKAYPGKGLWALPGGFLDANETIKQGIVRELREETKLKVPVPVLEGSIREIKVFDSPGRSERGRTITHAGLIVLKDGALPKVRGADDAAKAKWVPLGEIDGSVLYEDHLDIINYFKARC